jgi:hypothetical protein
MTRPRRCWQSPGGGANRLPRRRIMIWRWPIPARSGAGNGRAGRPGLELFVTAQQLFEALGEQGERMASVTLTEQADCCRSWASWRRQRRSMRRRSLETKNWRSFRDVAVGKGNWRRCECCRSAMTRRSPSTKPPAPCLNSRTNPNRWPSPGTRSAWCIKRRGSSTRRKRLPPVPGAKNQTRMTDRANGQASSLGELRQSLRKII